jgi:hypothetical protein
MTRYPLTSIGEYIFADVVLSISRQDDEKMKGINSSGLRLFKNDRSIGENSITGSAPKNLAAAYLSSPNKISRQFSAQWLEDGLIMVPVHRHGVSVCSNQPDDVSHCIFCGWWPSFRKPIGYREILALEC